MAVRLAKPLTLFEYAVVKIIDSERWHPRQSLYHADQDAGERGCLNTADTLLNCASGNQFCDAAALGGSKASSPSTVEKS